MKMEKKPKKLVTNLYDETEYVIHIRNFKQPLSNGLISKKVLRVIKFNQEVWLKPCFEMNTKLKKKQEIIFRL